MVRSGTRRSSLSPRPRPSWLKALTGRRADQSRSPARTASNLPEVSEKPAASESEVSGLPQTMAESPLSMSPPPGSGGLPTAASADGARSARFLSSGELVSSPLLTPSDQHDVARRPSVRFEPDIRGTASAPDVHAPVRPSLSVEGEDAGVTRSRTMPAVFTEAERVRAEEIGKEEQEK